MGYIVLWARDSDFSPYETDKDACPQVDVQTTLEDVRKCCVHVLRRHPQAVFRIFEVTRGWDVQVSIPDAIVSLTEAGEVK